MVAASVAALTVYDMTKALDKGIRIREVALVSRPAAKVVTTGGSRAFSLWV